MQRKTRQRFLLILAVLALQSNYVLATRFTHGGVDPRLPWDIFPFEVAWIVPYTLCFPLWTAAGVWLIYHMDDQLFRATVAGLLLTCSIGIATFIVFPTFIVDPIVTGCDFISRLMLFTQQLDGNYAAFPSSHIYVSTGLALFYGKWYPRHRLLIALTFTMIALSTLFTHQHYVLDVVGGIVNGWIGFRFGLWWARQKPNPGVSA